MRIVSISLSKYRNQAFKKKRKSAVHPWYAYLRRKKKMGRHLSEEWGEIERREKKPGGQWWEAAKEDVLQQDATWGQ